MHEEAPSQARCARHPERIAEMPCARCGTFICAGCVVSLDLCPACRTLLYQRGEPWTPEERARAAARRYLRGGTWLLRGMLGSAACALALLLPLGAGTGLSGGSGSLLAGAGTALGGLSVLLGLLAAAAAGLGFRRSQRGRPGPALEGVFPVGSAAAMVGVGLLPLLVALLVALR